MDYPIDIYAFCMDIIDIKPFLIIFFAGVGGALYVITPNINWPERFLNDGPFPRNSFGRCPRGSLSRSLQKCFVSLRFVILLFYGGLIGWLAG